MISNRTVKWKFLAIPFFLFTFLYTQIKAYLFIFSKFSAWDDEGFLLISTKTFLQGNPLYDITFTQYGPFYYLIQEILYNIIKIPFNHNNARLVTMALWAVSAVLVSVYTYKKTNNWIITILVYVIAWNNLQALSITPSHPQELAIALVAVVPLLSLIKNEIKRDVLIACIATALLFTKINLGVFLLLAFFVVLCSLPNENKWLSFGKKLFFVLICFVPIALMRQRLQELWVQNLCFVITVGFVPLLHQIYSNPKKWSQKSIIHHFIYSFAAIAVTASLILGYVFFQGTTLKALVDGVLIQPSKFPLLFSRFLPSQPGSVLITTLGVFFYFYCKKVLINLTPRWIYYAKLLLAVILLSWSYFGVMTCGNCINYIVNYSLSFLWLTLISNESEEETQKHYFSRLMLVMAAYTQVLMTFPVAGTQKLLATFLLIPLMAINFWDSFSVLREDFLILWEKKFLKPVIVGLSICIFAYLAIQTTAIMTFWDKYNSRNSLNFIGSEHIRLSERETATYQWLIKNLHASSDTFVSAPGFPSFYFWAEKEPPSTITQNCWQAFLGSDQQKEIINKLRKYNSVCAIKNKVWSDFWISDRNNIDLPLANYIDNEFKVIGEVDHYQFCVKKDREVELTFTAQIKQKMLLENGITTYPTLISLNLPILNQIAYDFAVIDLDSDKTVFDTRKNKALLYITEQPLELPDQKFNGLSLNQPRKFDLIVELLEPVSSTFLVVRLLDKEGHVVASVPVVK